MTLDRLHFPNHEHNSNQVSIHFRKYGPVSFTGQILPPEIQYNGMSLECFIFDHDIFQHGVEWCSKL